MFTVISLFSGIGGIDIGFEGKVVVHKDSISKDEFIEKESTTQDFVELKENNFRIVFRNDIDTGAKYVANLNGHDENYIIESIYDLLNRNYTFPSSDVVLGGFPCTDFSHCGKRRGFQSEKSHNLKDDVDDNNNRGTLYKSFVSVVERVRPKIFVAENVYGLLTMPDNPIEKIIEDFTRVGYDVKYQLIDCSEYGIPQKRKRIIIIGISYQREEQHLEENWNMIYKNRIKCNIGKYFAHLEEPNETDDLSQKLYSKAKKLERGQGQKEIDLNAAAPTMRAEHHGNIEFRRHHNSLLNPHESDLEERRLTLREAGLIQTFSPEYIFTDKITMRSYKYIGNAVPPLLGYLIADKVSDLLLKYF
tara:strand:+ start:756 stop:1838 length:1083 start_codon:yes stop_codon:yes gene_type:complete